MNSFKSILSLGAFLLLLIPLSDLSAQFFRVNSRPVQPEVLFWQQVGDRNGREKLDDGQYTSYEELGNYIGSPYLLESLSAGKIVDMGGAVYKANYLNVDAYSDEFIMSKTNNLADNDYIWPEKRSIDYIEVLDTSSGRPIDRVFKYIPLEYRGETLGICEILYANEDLGIQVQLKHRRLFKDAGRSTNLFAGTPAKFTDSEWMFVFQEGEGLTRIKKEKDFLELFGNDAKKVEKLMREMNLDYKNSAHLSQIFSAFPNSLS